MFFKPYYRIENIFTKTSFIASYCYILNNIDRILQSNVSMLTNSPILTKIFSF